MAESAKTWNSTCVKSTPAIPIAKKWFKHRPELFTSQAVEVIDDPTVEILIEALGFQEPARSGYFP